MKTHSRTILNNRLVDAKRARLNAISAASLYGRGVFTTLAIYEKRPFLWREHYRRLCAHAKALSVDHEPLESEESFYAQLNRLIEANKVTRGRARVSLLARENTGVWRTVKLQDEVSGDASSAKTRSAASDLLIITGDARASREGGMNLTLSPYRVNTLSPLAGIKSINYLEHLSAWEEARRRDFDEAVVMNERGEIVSATMANIFWVTDGKLYTPALSTGALDGTTRACVLRLADELAVPIVEGVYELSHLAEANEIFLTSSGLGAQLVTTFDFRRYTAATAIVTQSLQTAFHALIIRGAEVSM